mmetsp:Transcript_58302/g.188799  ORF Transcript_58302/g.188799 Transcript_58302/m.188799 type:complete len:216 (-) Transcript_58302:63-710(-)
MLSTPNFCWRRLKMTLSVATSFLHMAASAEQPPHCEHWPWTRVWAASQGLSWSAVSCCAAQSSRSAQVAETPPTGQSSWQVSTVVVVIVLVVKVRDMDVRDVNFRVVDVGVLVVWIVVVVDGHPRASCSQHHAFQSGDQAVSHRSYSTEQSQSGKVKGVVLSSSCSRALACTAHSNELTAAPRSTTGDIGINSLARAAPQEPSAREAVGAPLCAM